MSTRLNQIIALAPARKNKAKATLTEAYHKIKKPDLFSGLARTYQPRTEDGEAQPSERKNVQVSAQDLIKGIRSDLVEMYDTIATMDRANCAAVGNVVVGGVTVLDRVPVTTLLFLEKQLVDLKTFCEALPTLDPAEEWESNKGSGNFSSKPTQTNRTKKIPRNHVKAEATDKHPAQVEVYQEDVVVGTWTAIKFSGALVAQVKSDMVARVQQLLDAVMTAREEANNTVVTQASIGTKLLDFVFDAK